MPELQSWTEIKDISATAALFVFLIFFARAYLNNVANIAKTITDSTTAHIQALSKVSEALGELTLQVMRNNDVIVKCKGQPQKEEQHERPRNQAD